MRTALMVCLCLPLIGCVERWIQVRTQPSGARVFVDGEEVGRSPIRVAFDHYGTREVLVHLDAGTDSDRTYGAVSHLVELRAPWYQWFPLDLITETIWPWNFVDEHEVSIVLPVINPEARSKSLRHQLDGQEKPSLDEDSDS